MWEHGRRGAIWAVIGVVLATASPALARPSVPGLVGRAGLEVPGIVDQHCGEGHVGLPLGTAGGEVLCTHGPDDHPHVHAAAGARSRGTLPSTAPACTGTGADGARVQVLYVHAAGTPDRSAQLDTDLRRWAGQVDWTVARSAERLGGERRVRFVTHATPDGCRIDVGSVALPATALVDFAATIRALAEAGFDAPDRRYLLFVDREDYCGIATAPRDDRRGAVNRAERATGYGRVDRPCWDMGDRGYRSIAAHELIHTLGAVQSSAPHATTGAHCTDEWDLLCYADGDGVQVAHRCVDGLQATEQEGDHNDRLLDCGGDDYFHPDPPAGSYLASHWNVADSSFLLAPATERPAPTRPGPTGPERDADPERAEESDPPAFDAVHRRIMVPAGREPLWLGLRRWWRPLS